MTIVIPRRVSTMAVVAGLVLLTGAAPACANPNARPSTAQRSIDWGPCEDAPGGHPARCGKVSVPVDWDVPDGPEIDVRVAKLPAADPQQRIGTLMFNPGGPGGPAAAIVASPGAIAQYFPQEIRDRFDIVGIDPRGVGGSHPVGCDVPPHNPEVSRFSPRTRLACVP